ncbi:hypothetical protein BDF20DRAFT_833631 [Mycotypha africana]|uniref:uncharacterized protein n=1 Tax=Mycotypha africana TaxID=64632 RepID=UPI002300097A|nr:uncharacterized protein BDF20DRAFT_833631 [Mycotypha africana]KAI8984096.1 hypothetical protein BDF20DRAFT_833631 [Mycotypha africana]
MSAKSVRFDPVETIYTTYSADEYDRSRFAFRSSPKQYTIFRPNMSANTIAAVDLLSKITTDATDKCSPTVTAAVTDSRLFIPSLDLSVIPNSRRRLLDSSTDEIEVSFSSSSTTKKTKKPKLTINTHSLTPLIFTELTTHYKCKPEDEEEEHGYLIPVSAC